VETLVSPTDDTVLIQRCLKGETETYGQLVDKYSAKIINLAAMMITNRHDAEDIAQDAFVRAYKALPAFERKAKFSSWLYQITLNLCKDYLKSRSRSGRNIDDEHISAIDEGTRNIAPRILLKAELSDRMRQCIAKLPYLYREAFVLRHLHGTDYDEIAGVTGTSADTVRVRAYRAREMLREMLSPDVDTYWREKAVKEK
jgi:RNA polymerase sigma-70 factor, ECF subfamily